MIKFFFFITIFLYKIYEIKGLTEFDKDEMKSCVNVQPKQDIECLKNKYKSLLCCYFSMTQPLKGKVCVPFGFDSAGRKNKNANVTLYSNLIIQGEYSCISSYISISVVIFLLILTLI